MINTRIYKVLTSLDKPMLNRFSKFIHSPYHNVNEKISGLVDLLIEAIKSEKELPDKKDIWKRLKIKGGYEDVKFRKLCNDSLEKFEIFLVNEKFNENELLKSNLLLESIRIENLDILLEKNVSRLNRSINRQIDQSSEFYLQRYFFEKTLQSLKDKLNNKKITKLLPGDKKHESLSIYLDIFYVVEKLRFAADAITRSKLYKTESDINLDQTIAIIKKHNLESFPSVKIYLYMYKIHTEENDYQSYDILKDYTFENVEQFPKEERREILDALFSFCIKQINQGNEKFLTELLELYDWGIDSEIILINNILSHTSFNNYIVSGLRAGKFDRVESFIINQSHYLEPSRRDNAVNFNLARVSIYKKEYEKVIEYLNQVNYDDIWYNLNSKIYLLLAYYELGEDMVLESLIDSFQTFLRRQKSLQDLKIQMFSNFVKYLKKIYRSKNSNKLSIENLKVQLIAEDKIINKSWLLEKIDELL